ncbi:molybdopterin biosynthesis protein [Azospirillum sp. TSH100]|uniref:molybdopterin-binding protein n=1 Tax=Azospirillum sp. TSH100 TaxID=652764 RepID=UPI000D609C14|nr:molybdopterin-binding protein [Azospirillum sp. TSH100]PWC82883.1 molybdopterin biosynthesis protein [Azospirillum sp. TSH100]QCG86621.1 molybdopterin biosynthesis protein [Azospirillum sp. TSH100]
MREPASPLHDVRGRGFARRSPLTEGWAWIDDRVAAPAVRLLPLSDCAGLRLADAVAAVGDWPPADRAALDGYAVAAADTLGAGSYNPVPLTAAVAVSAGDALPPGCDAVIPYEAAQAVGPFIEAIDAVAPGSGVERRGAWTAAGRPLLPAGRRLRPADLGLLAAAGHDAVPVLPAPRVRILLAGGPKAGAPEQLGAMLAALVRRDGGVVAAVETPAAGIDVLAEALVRPGADLILSAGRTGAGPDDVAPPALARAGSLDLHGIAMRPGGSAGAGLAGGIPVLLLPGEPMAVLAAYELLAGRAVRRAAGLPAGLPHATVQAVTARKLVSEIGCLDLHRVRLDEDGRVEPVASPGWPGLAAAARADGFVLIGADSEGVPDGVPVTMYRFD